MAQRYDRLQIEINEPILSIVTAIQNDTNSRYLDVSLYDGGVPIPLTGNTVRIHTKNIHGVTSFEQGEITDADNGRCQFLLTTQMLSAADALETQISIWSGDQQVLSTQKFQIYVMPTLRDDTAVESTNEYGALVVLFSEIQNALDDMHAIRENFGEPSEESIQAGTDTFWKVIEKLVADVQTAVAYDLPEKVGDPDDTSDMPTIFGKISLNNELLQANLGGEEIFDTPGPFEFTVPENVINLRIVAAGGGGGGGNYTTGSGAGGGGGGADCITKIIKVTPGQKITGTIGTGGNGSDGSSMGADGTPTVINSIITVEGGKKGWAGNGGEATGTGGSGGPGGSSRNNRKSEDGQNGLYGYGGLASKAASQNDGGGGGGSYGNGGDGSLSSGEVPGKNGTHGGGGGGGTVRVPAGNGGDGIVIFRWGIFEGSEVPLK